MVLGLPPARPPPDCLPLKLHASPPLLWRWTPPPPHDPRTCFTLLFFSPRTPPRPRDTRPELRFLTPLSWVVFENNFSKNQFGLAIGGTILFRASLHFEFLLFPLGLCSVFPTLLPPPVPSGWDHDRPSSHFHVRPIIDCTCRTPQLEFQISGTT